MKKINNHTLAHTTGNCKYHIVFAPKFRRKILYNQKREIVGKILRKLCEWKDVEIFPLSLQGSSRSKKSRADALDFLDLKKLQTTERSPRRL